MREVTATFTTAGVTRAATASTALSSATSDDTLDSSSGPAAAAAACAELCPDKKAKVTISVTEASSGAAYLFVLATKELVDSGIVFLSIG
jgi:hypothetical protein